jgi:hypothetical protein
MYDVRVSFEMTVEDDLHLNRFWRESSLLECMFFIYEFDRNDGFRRVERDGFADRGICTLTNGLADEPEWQVRGEWCDLALCCC